MSIQMYRVICIMIAAGAAFMMIDAGTFVWYAMPQRQVMLTRLAVCVICGLAGGQFTRPARRLHILDGASILGTNAFAGLLIGLFTFRIATLIVTGGNFTPSVPPA